MGGRYAIVHGRKANKLPCNEMTGRFGPNKRKNPKSSGLFEREPLIDKVPKPRPPERAAVKESGVHVRCDTVAEAITTSEVQACSEIAEVVSEYERNRETHEGKIRTLLDHLSAPEINNLRYKLFAPHYDGHMGAHEMAIQLLLSQVPPIERLAFPRTNEKLIHDRVLEMSCGTGTVINLLAKSLPQERAAKMRITANDISDDMKLIARQKLASRLCQVDFTGQDISNLKLGQTFGTVILSQTLHLITDPAVVRQERQNNYMHVESDRHIDAKFKAIHRAWTRHLDLGGTMIIIDEWPALLSDRGGPLGAGFAYLFNDSLREIEYEDFRHSIMGELPGSRFVAQLKVPIDAKHAMHLVLYQRMPCRRTKRMLPETIENQALRNQMARRVVASFKSIDRRFIESFRVPNGKPWVSFRHMKPEGMFISKDGNIPDLREEFNCIVLDRVFHNMSRMERHRMLKQAIKALRVGGSLMIVGEWPSSPESPHPIRKSQLRSKYMKRYAKNLVYGGALRIPIHPDFDSGMFGYQYWRVL